MKKLLLKLWRDIKETKGQFISIMLVIALGCLFFAGMIEGSASIGRQVDTFYKTQNFADATGYFMYTNQLAVNEIEKDANVTAAEGRNTFYTSTTIDGGKKCDLTVMTLTSKVNIPLVTEGTLPARNECLVDYIFAEAYHIKIGDTVSFDINALSNVDLILAEGRDLEQKSEFKSVPYSFTVSGFYHSPELLYKLNAMDVAASANEFGFVLVNHSDINPFADGAMINGITSAMPGYKIPLLNCDDISVPVFNEIITDSTNDTEVTKLFESYTINSMDDLKEIFKDPNTRPAGLYMYTLLQKNTPSEAAFRPAFSQIQNLVSVIPMIFFLVAAIITFISLSKTVDNQRTQIGIMQAMGVSKGNIYFTYLLYALIAATIGALVGGFAGCYSIPFVYNMSFNIQFNMPMMQLDIQVYYIVVGLIIAVAVALLSAFVSCHRTLKEIPAQALRPKPPKKTRKILLERWKWFWGKIGFGAKMIFRNIFLHKTRILLSSVGVIGCLALLIGGLGLKDRVDFIMRHYAASGNYDIQATINSTTNIETLDYDMVIGEDPSENIASITFAPQLSLKISFQGKTKDVTTIALPSDKSMEHFSKSNLDTVNLYRDYGSNDKLQFTEKTFALPEIFASDMGIQVGDVISVSTYTNDNQNVKTTIRVTDIIMQYLDQTAYASYEIFQNAGFGLYADSCYIDLKNPSDIDQAKSILASREEIRSARTFTELADNAKSQVSILDAVVTLIIAGAAVLAIAVIYNITSINVLERTREIATLMVLGYKKHETNRLIIIENVVITFIGCIIGLPLGFGLLTWLVNIVNSMNICLPGNLTYYVALICIALTFVFSLIATFMLNRKMQKISMVEALKSVE